MHLDRPTPRPTTAEEARIVLWEGNRRFLSGNPWHPNRSAEYRASLVREQRPFATVLTCSDSRVPPELIFDLGVGDLFVIRVAGNVVDAAVAASVEYAVEYLHTPLVLVMGHDHCGAITAALNARGGESSHSREMELLLELITPCLPDPEDALPFEQALDIAIEANVRRMVQRLQTLPEMRATLEAGDSDIQGAIYNLHRGDVVLLSEHWS